MKISKGNIEILTKHTRRDHWSSIQCKSQIPTLTLGLHNIIAVFHHLLSLRINCGLHYHPSFGQFFSNPYSLLKLLKYIDRNKGNYATLINTMNIRDLKQDPEEHC